MNYRHNWLSIDLNFQKVASSRAGVPESTQSLELAPASGSGIGKEVADELLSRPGFAKKLADCLERGLTAKRSFWVSTGKGEGYREEEDDTRSQLQAAFGIMAHMVGEPIKRIIHQHLGADGKLDLRGALQDSPELAAAVAAELEKAKWRTSGQQAHKRPKKADPVVEGEAGPAKEF